MISRRNDQELIEADTVLVAAGLRPNLDLYKRLANEKVAPEVYSIGDPQFASHAIHTVKEAFKLALRI